MVVGQEQEDSRKKQRQAKMWRFLLVVEVLLIGLETIVMAGVILGMQPKLVAALHSNSDRLKMRV